MSAAQEAVQFLISKGKLNPDGSTSGRKKAKLSTAPKSSGTAVRIEGKGLEVRKDSSHGQRVAGEFRRCLKSNLKAVRVDD